ncbi:putative nuclease HARBI1 [Bactrocera neohumeralis]|uniref:putative nuclease HARBI1 n=1 Tax=Bactrocera neohumeralis TaxID=98809 RepID=UPI00216591B6|nr:putative nuclease HARBI1 [Bactrocera neohumeralis]
MNSEEKMLIAKALALRSQINILLIDNSSRELLECLTTQHHALAKKIAELKKQHLIKDLGMPINSCWTKQRKNQFWEHDCQRNGSAFFKENFRMNRSSFDKLCDILRPLQKMDTNYRKAVPIEKRVAITLFALGSSAEYRSIANMFGVGKSTVCEILLEFCTEIWRLLQPSCFKMLPLNRENITELVTGFEVIGFPECLGAIDGCHIEIHPSSDEAVDYYNYKGWYSTVLMALVDAKYRFTYINVGSPGRCNDSQIYETSSLKKEMDSCPLLSEMSREISGVNVPVFIIGDSSFRFSKQLMKPYPFSVNQNNGEKVFNYALSKTRRVVENAFGHLKARFRRIGKGIDNSVRNANSIIRACCTRRQNPCDISYASDDPINGEMIRPALCTHFGKYMCIAEVSLGDIGIAEGDGRQTGDDNGDAATNVEDVAVSTEIWSGSEFVVPF